MNASTVIAARNAFALALKHTASATIVYICMMAHTYRSAGFNGRNESVITTFSNDGLVRVTMPNQSQPEHVQ